MEALVCRLQISQHLIPLFTVYRLSVLLTILFLVLFMTSAMSCSKFLRDAVGNVIGMRRFKAELARTPGEKIFQVGLLVYIPCFFLEHFLVPWYFIEQRVLHVTIDTSKIQLFGHSSFLHSISVVHEED